MLFTIEHLPAGDVFHKLARVFLCSVPAMQGALCVKAVQRRLALNVNGSEVVA